MPKVTPPLSNLPPGYSVGQGPDGVQYIVPNHLLPATDLALRSEHQKSLLNVHLAPGGVRCFPLSLFLSSHLLATFRHV